MKDYLWFLLFLLGINEIISFFNENKEFDESVTVVRTFEELDTVMKNSEWSKEWKRAKRIIEEGNYYDPEFDESIKEEKENKYFNSKLKNAFLGSSTEESCLLSSSETTKILKEKYDIINESPRNEIRFIVGKCNPVVLVPGIYSTKLQTRINCKGLYNDNPDIFEKVRFYCGESICKSTDKEYEEHDLFISALGSQFQIIKGDVNKYSACLGYFLTFFNTPDSCAKDDEDKSVCNYSPYIKIGYYGSTVLSKDKGKCGLEAIQNVIMTGISVFDDLINTGVTRSYKVLIEKLKSLGYQPGFSMGGIPNDYRKFLATNNFTNEAIRYQVEKLYEHTGKPVVLVGHSYGTLTLLSSLVKTSNKDLLPKIKKFIAIGPPFAGSTDLIDFFFHGLTMMKRTISQIGIETEFDNFGKEIMAHTMPTVMELRPLPIGGKLFNSEQYIEFADAIRERIKLEKDCGYSLCNRTTIEEGSKKFDSLFKGFFPSLTESDCEFDSSIKESFKYFNRKCLAVLYNLGDCPTIITKTGKFSPKFDELDSYCGKETENFYYQGECNGNRKCLDEIYYTKGPYPFEGTSEKAKYFIDNWNSVFASKFNKEKTMNDYVSKEKFLESTKRQIEYYNEISLTKDLPIPPIDTDIVYGNYKPTKASIILSEEDFTKEGDVLRKGGDGTVPNWSSLLTGLKWIYDKQKNDLPQKIRLIEFCSRLSYDSSFKYDPNKNQDFAAISCDCLDSNNSYSSDECNHSSMPGDSKLIEYIITILKESKEDSNIDEDRIKAVKNFDSNISYQNKCDQDLLRLLLDE